MAITQTKLTSISVQYFQLFKCINAHYTNNNSLPYTCTAHTHTHSHISRSESPARIPGVALGEAKSKFNHQLVIRLLSFHFARLTSAKNPFHSRIHNKTVQVIFLPSTWLYTDWAPLFRHQFLKRFSKLANAVSDLNKFIFYQYFNFVATNDSEQFVI